MAQTQIFSSSSPRRVNYSTKSGSIIGILFLVFDIKDEDMLCVNCLNVVCNQYNCHIEAILMNILNTCTRMSGEMEIFFQGIQRDFELILFKESSVFEPLHVLYNCIVSYYTRKQHSVTSC